MPVLERDPWRDQYFEHVPCPDDVLIPTDDPDCWALFPDHRWIYDKIRIAESQGIACGPHGVSPSRYPVFSKPIVNLKGMGLGSRAIADAEEMEQASRPGFMWMELLEGPHVSTDCAIENGSIVWSRHATGLPWNKGMFRYWTIHADKLPALESYLSDWTARHMTGYSGMLNFETIGGRIIEAHLRFADQWCDLYGKGWVEALVGLYSAGAGASMMASGAAATRSPSLRGTEAATGTPRRSCRRRSGPCRISPACRSRSTKPSPPPTTRCRPAASALPSSTLRILKPVTQRAASWRKPSPPKTCSIRARACPRYR